MSCYSKEKMERNDYSNICKSHSARSDRELYRICPSKLSKRELEDLYFSLLENNIELKRTINGQQDKIRGLSAKVQRMNAAQKNLQSKELKECCVGTKSMITEQRESITELKRANQRMADRIQMLNMRLCSAKQFFKKPAQASTSRCLRCAAAAANSTPKKHNCLDKASEPVLKISTSSQCEDRCKSMKSSQTDPSELDKETSDQPCDENKCRSLMEELKLKIVNLQEELFNVHDEYSTRITRLESEVSDVRKENVRVSGERRASEHELLNLAKRNSEILATCRNTESRCADLAAQLSIERRKVAELETQLKAANMSGKVNKTIEDHLTTRNETNGPLEETGDFVPKCICGCPRVPKDKAATKNVRCDACGCPPQAGDSEDSTGSPSKTGSAKSNPLKGTFSRVSSKGSKASKSSKTKTTPEGKFNSCACPPHQKGEPVHFTAEDSKTVSCACPPPPKDLTALTQDSKVAACACPPPKESSTPTKEKKGVDCGCPAWQEVELLAKRHQDENSKCVKCCFKGQEAGFSESSPTKTGTLPSLKVEDRWTPTAHHEDAKMSKASDDSGYLDSNKSQENDDLSVNKMNKELIARIIELQSQVDALKITGATELPTAKRNKLTEFSETPTNSIADSAILRYERQVNNQKPSKPEHSESTTTTVHIPTKPQMSISRDGSKSSTALFSQDVPERGEINKTIGDARTSEDTRVKTIEDAHGRIHIADERLHSEIIVIAPKIEPAKRKNSDAEYQELAVTKQTDNIEPEKSESAVKVKMPVIEENEPSKPELEADVPNITKYDIQQPYKLELNDMSKYLETETAIPKPELAETPKSPPDHHHRITDQTDSVIESVPSNPELGFHIPRLESKRESVSGDSKKLNETESPANNIEILPGKLKLPMTDALVANQAAHAKTVESSTPDKEECEHCAACSFNQQCAQQSRRSTIDNIANKNTVIKMPASKDDRHNSLQIPGPIPAEPNHKKKNVFRHFSFDKKKDKTKEKAGKHKKESMTKEDQIAQQKKVVEESSATAGGLINLPDVPLIDQALDRQDSLPDVSRNYYTLSKDSIGMHRKRLSSRNSLLKQESEPPPVQNVSMHNYLPQTDRMSSPPYNREDATQMERQTDEAQTTEQKLQDQANQASNDLAAARARRDVSVYRRASGTLCFRTLPARPPRACDCRDPSRCATRNSQVPETQDSKEVQATPQPSEQCRVSAASVRDTYTVDKQSRATSPDNTDFEMSYLSDLPLEKDKASPIKSRPLSPGEDKTTTTYTDSSCSPDTNYTLSEGEMPAYSKRRVSYEKDKQHKPMNGSVFPSADKQSEKIEAALQAVTDEIARCNTLLNTQRPTQPRRESCHSQTSVSDPTRPIALRRGVATQSIGDVYVPKCIFTLHIGTVVLSDEAVLNSRDKTLVLTWKFYDQNIAMTRMRAGRVVLFDFSTEYDIKITDEFLHYMKHEEMPIVICELDKEDQPFASCALPLRDALLHTNRRADMSLALVAGPQMVRARAAADALDARDEMGVLDLWCMLRADANLLPGINLAIAQPSAPVAAVITGHPRNSRVMPQILDDDHNDLELTLVKSTPVSTVENTGKNYIGDVEYTRTSNLWSTRPKPPAARLDAHTQTANLPPAAIRPEIFYDPNNYPPVRSRRLSCVSTVTGQSPTPTQLDLDKDDPEHDSGIIVNEVQAKIKSPGDMKHALERSCHQEHDVGRAPHKSDEDLTSQAQSSLGSLRSVLARLQRRGSRSTSRNESPQRTVIQNIKRSSRNSSESSRNTKEDATDMEIYRKYENISKLIGSNREQSKKSVKIVPKYMESEIEQPQRDVGEEAAEEEPERTGQNLDITVLWLALNEECEAMIDPHVQRVYVAYSFLGRTGAELETPVSLPKPKHYVDKCYFNFKKTFELEDTDLLKLSHMARCRAASKMSEDERDCIVFSVVSEPPEDPLGLESCEDIGYAYLYLGDLLAYSAGSPGYTEVIPVRAARGAAAVCGVLAVRLDGLDVVRRCLLLPSAERDVEWNS